MSRHRLIRSRTLPYHVYGRANNKEWFYLPSKTVWRIFVEQLDRAISEWGLCVHAFVLMSNHYHLVATTLGLPLDVVMCRLLKNVSDEINARAGRINHVFGGPYKWTLIKDWFQYHHVLRYVYQNPVRAGLCELVTEYPFSSLQQYTREVTLKIPTVSHLFERIAFQHIQDLGHPDWFSWFNKRYDTQHIKALKRGLYRRHFRFCADRNSRKIETEFLLPKALKKTI